MRTDDWLRTLPSPDPDGEDRVWQRLQASRQRPARRSWPLLATAGVVLAAAVALFALREPTRTVSFDGASNDVAWSDEIEVHFDGEGQAVGVDDNVVITWNHGTLRAEVAPQSGNHVEVHTAEATVTVVGTVFAVERSPLGTRTWVDRGEVDVRCADGTGGAVRADTEPLTCLPTRPGALLGRADALLAAGAEADTVLATLDLGLAASDPTDAVHGELLARRVEQLARARRTEEALDAAQRYLAAPDAPRRGEVRQAAVRLATALGRCDEARGWLDDDAEGWVALAACFTTSDRGEAAAEALRHARTLAPLPADWQRWLDAWEAR